MKAFPKTWQDLESAVQDELEYLQRIGPTMFQRFYDSKSAGNLMPKQPADFGVLHKGHWAYLEVKHSKKSETLKSVFASAVRANQLASARLAARAGGSYFILFASLVDEQYELWDGAYCATRRMESKQLQLQQRLLITEDLKEVLAYFLK